jgi:hypothetical protein
MYTKSIIQQKVEDLKVKDNFRTAIEQLLEKYNIEDSVFTMRNGFLHEVVEGYFVVENNFDSLDEAVSSCDLRTMGVRVLGGVFQIGKLHNRISECESEKKVFDLSRLEDVR